MEVVGMTLSPYSGRGFFDVQSEMNRLFDDMLGTMLGRGSGRTQGTGQLSQWAPAMDVLSEGGDIVVRAELAGVKPEDVDITLQDRVLTISGERKAEEERQGAGYYVKERRHGAFRRSMQLPESVDEDSIHARYDNGVLEVRVKGAAAVREPKRIQIEGAGGGSAG